ncbi:MAG TPA: DNA mismatch repair endonuclease MutL [Paludibacter sp.]|nr:DNA mismatch repair endonuclease MutL [Paludibacter sp.]
MSDIIHLLPDSVANQIAAGEVIQRPASVLKELVENAIDAGADFIRIIIKDAGKTLIQVIDNGKGMSETDARMAFERHATSKIKEASDLFSLRTMGFRGEALASIAAIAQVELRTRRAEDELGVMVEIAGTRVFKQEAIHCDSGTSFLIKNLFFNVPARRRFLKSDNVEKSHLLNEFYHIVLVNPQVEFSLYDGDDEIFRLPPSNYKIRIENVFGKNLKKRLQQQLLTIETSTNIISINGFVGKPEFAQKSPYQYFFVNGRYMRHPYFHKAVMLAYNQLIQASESPNYFIYFEVDPGSIDINIHPTKTEIKFENEQAIWSILNATVKEALGKFNIIPSIDFDQEGAPEIPMAGSVENILPPQTNFNPHYNPFRASTYKRPDMDWDKLYGGFEQKNEPILPENTDYKRDDIFASKSETIDQQQTIEDEDIISSSNFQFKNKYILTNVKSGMLLIDQHRAHVRILFEMYLSQIQNRKGMSQQILFPEVLVLDSESSLFFDQIKNELITVGFDFENAGENSYHVTAIPSQLGSVSVISLLNEMIAAIKQTQQNPVRSFHESLALSLANATALKSGQSLSSEEMNDLINKLFSCSNHNYTPDGKVVLSIITNEELQSKFR